MSQPVLLENEHLRLEIWPQYGGKISSLSDKADGYELLTTLPVELPTRCPYDCSYADTWPAGWDECFPSLLPGNYPLYPYQNIAVPDHGELWSLPTTCVPTRDGITTVWQGLRFGYRLTRKLFLEGPCVVAEYTLINLSPFDFPFLWTPQILLSVPSAIQTDLPKNEVLQNGLCWPQLDAEYQFEEVNQLPPGRTWCVHFRQPIRHPVVIRYPERKRLLQIDFGSDTGVNAFWRLAVNTGTPAGPKSVTLAPATGRSDQLADSFNDASAAVLAASGRSNWQIRLSMLPLSSD